MTIQQCDCGFKNQGDAKFCRACGAALEPNRSRASFQANGAANVPTNATATGRSVARWTIVAGALALAAAGYWWIHRPPESYHRDNSGLYPIHMDGKFGFMDRSGKTKITPQFDEAGGFSEGLGSVRVGTKWGYVDTNGSLVITPQFQQALEFRNGLAAVEICCSDGNQRTRFAFIDKDGKFLSTPEFSQATSFSGKFAVVWMTDGRPALLDRSGKVLHAGKFDYLADFSGDLAPAAVGGKWGFINTAGDWIVNPQFEAVQPFGDRLAAAQVGGRWGCIDKKGKFAVNPQFEAIAQFHDDRAWFSSNSKLGFLDSDCRVIIPANFVSTGDFSEGLAHVSTQDGDGYIDKMGNMVIDGPFDAAYAFQNGLAKVWVLGKEAYITTTGAFVINPFPGTTPRAERARLAAESAQSAVREAAAQRSRIESMIGAWVGGAFGTQFVVLTITSDNDNLSASLENDGWRESFRVETVGGKLVLTGTGATQQGPSRSSTYSLDTITLELSTDAASVNGEYRDAAGRSGTFSLSRATGD